MGTLDDILILRKGESLVERNIDFSEIDEIATGEQTIDEVPTLTVLDSSGTTSAHLTVSGVTLDPTFSIVQFKITVEDDAVEGDEYEISCPVLLSEGATIRECLGVVIERC